MTNSGRVSATVEREARALGFHLAGITRVPEPGGCDEFAELEAFPQWIAEGRGGAMEYLQRQDAEGKYLRSSLRTPFPWARSVIVCAVNYNTAQPYSMDPAPKGAGWIARYAWSGVGNKTGNVAGKDESVALEPTDYHTVMRDKLEQLSQKLQTEVGAFTARCFVDTGPLVERVYAKYAGLGWQGKNTCLLNEKLGSWFFLGVIVTSLELTREDWTAPMADRCGSCTRCIDACPTQCLEAYRMDASRCIAYLTIEKRGEIPAELQPAIGRNVFGCDICQEVCPWNGKAPITDWPELTARPELVNPALEWLENLDEQAYRRLFRKSPISRTKYAGLQRNVAIARSNQSTGDGK
ncbi:MAG TPA: tRNA epoxyqueuosine(34) reductase QueG [Acidobacteriaceae bacterium]|nr:tRNA epoxyqueuosine(34) reductase QueG [Acidobacteriaceae bacterium]